MRSHILRKYLFAFAIAMVLSAVTSYVTQLKPWHKYVGWPEGLATWAVVFTLFAIAEQTQQTARANAAAENAVRTAEAALALQRETSKAQLRAYVGVKSAKLRWRRDGTAEVHIAVHNCGQTPAYSWTGAADCFFTTFPVGTLGKPASERPKGSAIMLPGLPSLISLDAINADNPDLKRLESGPHEVVLCVYGYYTYTDIFKDSHFTKFQMILGGPVPVVRYDSTDGDGAKVAYFAMDSTGNESN